MEMPNSHQTNGTPVAVGTDCGMYCTCIVIPSLKPSGTTTIIICPSGVCSWRCWPGLAPGGSCTCIVAKLGWTCGAAIACTVGTAGAAVGIVVVM